MDNLIESLLSLDDKNFNSETTKQVEIKRLSKATGSPFFVTIKSLEPARIYEVQDKSLDGKGNVSMNRFYKGALESCSESIIEPNFNDERLKKKLHLHEKALKIDVIKKIFKVSEINKINSEIMSISGFDEASDDINSSDTKYPQGENLVKELKKD